MNELNQLLVKYLFKEGSGFSHKFILILAVGCNFLPFTVARLQRIDYQLQGIVGATLLYSLILLFYIYFYLY